MLRGARVDLGQLLQLPLPGEQLVELRERRAVTRRQRERPLEVSDRARLVAEDVSEEPTRLEEELGSHGRLQGPQALALRDALEGKRDLAQPIVPMSRYVKPLPCVRRESGACERREHRVDEGLFIVDLRLEREGGHVLAEPSPRRLLLHGKPSVRPAAALLPLG